MAILTVLSSSKQAEQHLDLAAFPPHIREALESEGINSIADWRKLSRKRRPGIFGVTKKTAELLSRAARELQQ